jgi:hypothetical protein
VLFSDYERIGEPLASRRLFVRRLGLNLGLAVILIAILLVIGVLGYRILEGLSWLDAYAHAAMILSGMGPYDEPATAGGKFFEGTYALFSGLVVVATTGLILAPVLHRIMHGLHVPDESDEERAEVRKSRAPKRARGRRQSGKAGPAG